MLTNLMILALVAAAYLALAHAALAAKSAVDTWRANRAYRLRVTDFDRAAADFGMTRRAR